MAAGVVVTLAIGAVLAHASTLAWVWLPLAVAAVLTGSLRRARNRRSTAIGSRA